MSMEMKDYKILVTEMSRKLEEAYMDICKSHGLTIHQECKSYLDELVYSGVDKYVEAYKNEYDKIRCEFLIRYIKSSNPCFYKQHMNFIECHNKEYQKILNFIFLGDLSLVMWLNWQDILREVKY